MLRPLSRCCSLGFFLVSCALFVLTVLYASDTTLFGQPSATGLSSGNVILIIRVLSGLASFFISALVISAFDRVRWMLVARKKGASMLDFLTLASGTGTLAWVAVGLTKSKGMVRSRAWAYSRILALLIVNALGIIILSDVSTETVFLSHSTFAVTAGIGTFEPSFATNDDEKLLTGIYMATDFSRYLTDSALTFPTTPVTPQPSSCKPNGISSQNCTLSYFTTGGLSSIAPWPYNIQDDLVSPVYTVFENAGYQFDFLPADDSVQYQGTNCIQYGEDVDGFQLCLKATDLNTLDARFRYCAGGGCSSEPQQISNSINLSLRAYRRHATVQYSRFNSSILSISSLSSPSLVELDTTVLFQVYNSSFNPIAGLGRITAGQQFQQFFGNWLYTSAATPQTAAARLMPVRNLLILPLIYFQANYLNPSLQPSPNSPAPGLPDELNTKASLSTTQTRLVVALWSLIAYTAIGAVVLALCMVVFICGSLQVAAGGVPDVSRWPALDLALIEGERKGEVRNIDKAEKASSTVAEHETAEASGLMQKLKAYQTDGNGNGIVRRLESLRVYVRAK